MFLSEHNLLSRHIPFGTISPSFGLSPRLPLGEPCVTAEAPFRADSGLHRWTKPEGSAGLCGHTPFDSRYRELSV